ncbi:MAG: family 43 glycosylhydrolase [Verrucomicrobiales bacterium]|nr:family 43 glycosylhydrolase [Verrucomicrobiales bacterium]
MAEFQAGAWDPAFFLDDDGRLYHYYGSSNTYPLYGQEIDSETLGLVGERKEMIRLDDAEHGWERFGEANDNTFLRPFAEGAWMTRHNSKYYLQYGAPGTEFSGYADGVYVGNQSLGPFTYQGHNPFSYKPGGFARGAGHGATFQDPGGHWWHVSTITLAVKNNFERRIGIWPAGFDQDGILYCNTTYGDYPHYLPGFRNRGRFADWMLLNYAKPVRASYHSRRVFRHGILGRRFHELENGAFGGQLRSTSRGQPEIAREFDTTENFHQLRIDPYLLTAARGHPSLASILEEESAA